jgi:hypothetical protein
MVAAFESTCISLVTVYRAELLSAGASRGASATALASTTSSAAPARFAAITS